jgi:hypothetical protein
MRWWLCETFPAQLCPYGNKIHLHHKIKSNCLCKFHRRASCIVSILLMFPYIHTYTCSQLLQRQTACWMAGFDFQQGQQTFLFTTASRPALRHTQPPIQWMGSRDYSLRDTVARVSSWPLTSIYCQGQEWQSYTSIPPYIFMTWCLINYAQRQLNLFFFFYYFLSSLFQFIHYPTIHSAAAESILK